MNKKEEIFTIGDKTNNGTISKFELDSNGIRVFFEEKPKNHHVSLNSLSKVQQKLFRTEDEVDIFEGDSLYLLSTNNWIISNISPIRDLKGHPFEGATGKEFKYFSTLEAAEEFIYRNKPKLSLNDVFKIYPEFKRLQPNVLTNHAKKLHELCN